MLLRRSLLMCVIPFAMVCEVIPVGLLSSYTLTVANPALRVLLGQLKTACTLLSAGCQLTQRRHRGGILPQFFQCSQPDLPIRTKEQRRRAGRRACGKRSSRVADHWPHLMKAAPLCRMPSSSSRHARMRSRAAQRSAQLHRKAPTHLSTSTVSGQSDMLQSRSRPCWTWPAAMSTSDRTLCRHGLACSKQHCPELTPVISCSNPACSRHRDLLYDLHCGVRSCAWRLCSVLLCRGDCPSQAGLRWNALFGCCLGQGDARRQPASQAGHRASVLSTTFE